jgi:uncharacterized protein DUF4291
VYQAYAPEIADAAIEAGKFVKPFRRDRTTWIKPSFLWMMYRCSWATKAGQQRVLAIDISHDGFEWALANAVLSYWEPQIYESEAMWRSLQHSASVVVQWDPERGLDMQKLDYRTIQIGLKRKAIDQYVEEWTQAISDITEQVKKIDEMKQRDPRRALSLLPEEKLYPIPDDIARNIAAD